MQDWEKFSGEDNSSTKKLWPPCFFKRWFLASNEGVYEKVFRKRTQGWKARERRKHKRVFFETLVLFFFRGGRGLSEQKRVVALSFLVFLSLGTFGCFWA